MIAGRPWCSALLLAVAWGCSLRELDELEATAEALREPSCPDEMQRAQLAGGGSFCIDRYETTRGELDEFLGAPPPVEAAEQAAPPEEPLAPQDAELCRAPVDLAPGAGPDCAEPYQAGINPELPVTCVNLCEAMAYCQFRGKRLCGAADGSTGTGADIDEPAQDEWFLACAGEKERLYPYGSSFEADTCNVSSSALQPPGSAASCSTLEGVYDLSGNVAEWVLICAPFPKRAETRCLIRGGSFLTEEPNYAECRQGPRRVSRAPFNPQLTRAIGERSPDVGIRCCRD